MKKTRAKKSVVARAGSARVGAEAPISAATVALRATTDGLPTSTDLVARSATAAGKATTPTHSEAMLEHWRKVRAGERTHLKSAEAEPIRSVNPLYDLPDKARAHLLMWLRECPFEDAIDQFLEAQGLTGITRGQLDDFFQFESEQHWEQRITRAAQEANALVRLVEKSTPKFSAGILAALGQEAFRQIASGQVEPDAMAKLAVLFMRARSDERADQMQELKREKLRHELQDQFEHALEKLAEEVDRHPAAREAFEALKRELAEHGEDNA